VFLAVLGHIRFQPMTILASLIDETGSLVLAADGKEWKTDDVLHIQLWSPCDKFMAVPHTDDDQSLAWGYSGRGEGDELASWFAVQSFESWNDVKSKLAPKIAEINATLLDPKDPQLGSIGDNVFSKVSVVVAGFVRGEMGVFAMDSLTGIFPTIGKAIFVGMGAEDKAAPEWRERISAGSLETREEFVSFLTRLIDEHPWLQLPLNVWVVTAEGLKRVAQIP
jgi:hypothetical protein